MGRTKDELQVDDEQGSSVMTHPEPPTSPSNAPTFNSSRSLSVWVVAAPAVALIVGLALGALVTGVATSEGENASAPDVSTAPSAPPADGSGADIVPSACRKAAETVSEATNLIRERVGAIRDFRSEQILDLLNQLEDLDAQAREQAELCTDIDISASPSPAEPGESSP